MEINIDLLQIQNPWWFGRSLKFDPVIEAFNNQYYKFSSLAINTRFQAGKIIYFYGTYNSGKSTLAKLKIKELIESGEKAENILYYSGKNLETYEQLNEILKVFLKHRKNEKNFIFIDDISNLNNWEKGLEYLKKSGKLKNSEILCFGTKLPKDRNIESKKINPLSFLDFLSLLNPKLSLKPGKDNYNKIAHKLDYYLDIYFLTGGFINNINQYKAGGRVDHSEYENFISWLNIEIAKSGRDINLARQILEQVILNLGEPIGYKTIAAKTKAKTHLTVAEYLDFLQTLGVIKMVYQKENGQGTSRKAKKIFFPDPFLFWVFYAYVYGANDPWRFGREKLHEKNIFESLIKNVVFSFLEREPKPVFYWRDSKTHKEVDFVIRDLPIIIEYEGKFDKSDWNYKDKAMSKGIIVTKKRLDKIGRIDVMPLPYFLLNQGLQNSLS